VGSARGALSFSANLCGWVAGTERRGLAARRHEIPTYWREQMGPWPELLAKPKTIISEPQDLGSGGVQHRIEVEVATYPRFGDCAVAEGGCSVSRRAVGCDPCRGGEVIG